MNELLHRREVLVVGLALALAVLVLVGLRVRKVAKSDRPDKPLAKLATLVGLGWSSEAVWEITGKAGLPTHVRVALFCVFEIMFLLAMMRAEQHMATHRWPGRPGHTVWGLATVMGTVSIFAGHSLAESLLRLAIPLALTKLWWDSVTGGQAKPDTGQASWRWTPRRALLAIGALEPGERDMAKVHRDQLANRMTALYSRLDNGPKWLRRRRATKLAKLSLDADAAIIASVRSRVANAQWFEAVATPAVAAEVVANDHADWPDPWNYATPIADQGTVAKGSGQTVDGQVANWMASTGGQQAIAVAKQRVAKQRVASPKASATYDQDEARAMVRLLLGQFHPDLTGRELDKAKSNVDAAVAAKFNVSPRTARRLRGQVSGEPISGLPNATPDGHAGIQTQSSDQH